MIIYNSLEYWREYERRKAALSPCGPDEYEAAIMDIVENMESEDNPVADLGGV